MKNVLQIIFFGTSKLIFWKTETLNYFLNSVGSKNCRNVQTRKIIVGKKHVIFSKVH